MPAKRLKRRWRVRLLLMPRSKSLLVTRNTEYVDEFTSEYEIAKLMDEAREHAQLTQDL